MYWQQRYLKEAASFDSTTAYQIVDLPKSGYLAGLDIRVWGTCGTGANKPDIWLHDRIKKFEVICNGSKVVKSLEGTQLLAIMMYMGILPHSHDHKNMSGASCEEFFHIPFGRFFHDIEFMLDLGRVTDPELVMDCDFTMTSRNGWSNGVAMSSAPSFSIVPHILRDAPGPPRGYIKTSEIARFTNAASKKENMMIPKGPVYASLYFQSFYASNGIGYMLDKLELNMNNDAIIPLRVGPNELSSINVRDFGKFVYSEQMSVTGGQAYPFPLEQGVARMGPLGLVAYEHQILDMWGQANSFGFKDISTGLTPYTGNLNVMPTYIGIWPFSVAHVPGIYLKDERTWINSGDLGDFWLRSEANSSGSSSAVVKLLADEVVTNYEPV